MILLVAALVAQTVSTAFEEWTFATGQHRTVTVAHQPLAASTANRGTAAGAPLTLPTRPAPQPGRPSALSPLLRARDSFDLSRFPARAVAKLFQLDAAGRRTGTACTAQFVAARFLVTAGHCLVDRTGGTAHAGFELAVGFDQGRSIATARVTRGWIAVDQLAATSPSDALVSSTRCSDDAVIEIDAPLGETTGWLAMRDAPPVAAGASDATMLYRFSYPQHSDVSTLVAMRDKPGQSDQVRAALDAAIARARAAEPAFSPDDLSFEYGPADRAEGLLIADRSGYNLPGRSGAALLDGTGAITALLSRGYSGETYSCRLTADRIGAIGAITRS